MERSTETKLATAVAVIFAVLSMGAIVQVSREGEERNAITAYLSASDPALSHMTARRLNLPLSGLRRGNEVGGH